MTRNSLFRPAPASPPVGTAPPVARARFRAAKGLAAVAVAGGLASQAALAQGAGSSAPGVAPAPGPVPREAPGRYTMTPVADGVLRLDTRNGAVAHCRLEGTGTSAGYACRAVPNERDALGAEIDRLAAENRDLRARLAAGPNAGGLEVGPDAGSSAAPRPAPGGSAGLPSEEEVDRALGLMERVLRRFMGIIREEAPTLGKPL